jgi:DNA invertase Pin-like site-specific DNA recombinase
VSGTVALYLRVSTEDQDLVGQERELRGYAQSRGWTVSAVFAEKTSASGRVERAAWEQLRAEACLPTTRRFEHVLVWALDRWSREASFVRAIGSIEELEVLGICWHSFREPQLDTIADGSASLARDILRGILPAIASFEARRRSERTQLAMDDIRAGRRPTRSGRPVGRPRRVTPEHERQLRELRAQGYRWADIAVKLHLPAGTCRKEGQRLGIPKPGRPSQEVTPRIREQILNLRAAGLGWRAIGGTVRFPVGVCKEVVAASRASINRVEKGSGGFRANSAARHTLDPSTEADPSPRKGTLSNNEAPREESG